MARCIVEDDLGRCRKKGKGDPPLCKDHETQELEYQEIIDAVLTHPAGKVVVDKVNNIVDSIASLINDYKKRPLGGTDQSPKPKIVVKKRNPREILHFGPNEALTIEKIETRKRALAKMAHPDIGGSKEAMEAILSAAAELKKQVKE